MKTIFLLALLLSGCADFKDPPLVVIRSWNEQIHDWQDPKTGEMYNGDTNAMGHIYCGGS